MLERKMLNLLSILIDKGNVSISELEQIINLSRRQIEYNLDKINNEFLSTPQELVLLSNGHLFLNKQSKQKIIEHINLEMTLNEYVLDNTERVRFILLILYYDYDQYISLNHLTDALKVGKTTIQSDLKQLEILLKQFSVSLIYNRKSGYQLEGKEFDIRYMMMRLIIEDLENETGNIVYDIFINIYSKWDLNETSKVIYENLEKHGLNIIEKRIRELTYVINILLKRLEIPFWDFYNKYNLPLFQKLVEFNFSKDILLYFNIKNEDAIIYITAWILGQTVGNYSEKTKDYSIIKELTNRVISRFEVISGVIFDNRERVIQQLYSHLRPTNYRMFFKLPIINPLTTSVKREFESLYYIVYETMKPIASLFDNTIPDDEVAFLTIHFASLIDDNDERHIRRKRAIVVCPNGLGSSAIVLNELKNLFPEIQFIGPVETRLIKDYQSDINIIFSTVQNVQLFMMDKPVFVVNPVLSTSEKYRLIRDVFTEIGNGVIKLPNVDSLLKIIEKNSEIKDENQLKSELYKYLSYTVNDVETIEPEIQLLDIMPDGLIQIDVEATDWKNAIRKSAQPLLIENYITENYVNEIIQTTEDLGPYMVITKHVALPHSKATDGVNKLGMGLTILKEPVVFSHKDNDPVKYIFFLASKDNKTHINALSQLLNLLDNEKFYKVLDESKDIELITSFIKNNISDSLR